MLAVENLGKKDVEVEYLSAAGEASDEQIDLGLVFLLLARVRLIEMQRLELLQLPKRGETVEVQFDAHQRIA